MSKLNKDFFSEKKDWSKIKDALLLGYLPEYFSKVLCTKMPILYIDCFAGKGRFDDGQDGSPRFALQARKKALLQSHSPFKKIETVFIEANYSNELRNNISDFETDGNISVLDGKYEEEIENILNTSHGKNIFLYIDPYGVKSLSFSFFEKLAKENKVEFLLNFNSFGFLRAGLSALHITGINFTFYDDEELNSVEPVYSFEDTSDLATRLDDVAGGNYWRDIVIDFRNGQMDSYQAEKLFTQKYIEQLQKLFKYVLNMPIKLKSSFQPKYRMIHVSNHEDGCYLMAANISNQTDKLVIEIQSHGQQSLFGESVENEIIDLRDIKIKILSMLVIAIHLKTFVVSFFNNYGMICKVSDVIAALKELETENKIKVFRTPAYTKQNKQSRFWEEKNDKKVLISKV